MCNNGTENAFDASHNLSSSGVHWEGSRVSSERGGYLSTLRALSLVHAKMPARHIVTSVWAKKWDDCARCGVMIKEKPLLRKCQWQKNIYFSWIWLLNARSLFLSQPTLQSLYSPSGVQNICFGSFSRQPARVQSHHLTTFIGWVGMLWLYFITWKQFQLSINSTPHSVCCCLRSTVIL